MNTDWAKRRFKFELSGRQANTILTALMNESVDEGLDHAYEKCYGAFAAQLSEQGFWSADKENK